MYGDLDAQSHKRQSRRGGCTERARQARNFHVLVPFGGGQPYDLVVDIQGRVLLRVQCKTAWPRSGCLLFNPHSDHGRGALSYIGLADIFGVYFPPNDTVYLVPTNAVNRHEGRLRLEPTRNNQRRRVRMAADYEVARWTEEALVALAPRATRTAGRTA